MRIVHMLSTQSRARHITGVLAAVVLTGCASTSRQTDFMSSVEGVDASTGEMRARTHEATVRFATLIAESGNQIRLASDDPEVRRNALRWKISGVSMVHQAGFHFDPLIGLVDLSVLAYQMGAFFTSGPGKDAFGPQQPLALAALERIGEELRKEARAVIDSAHISIPGDFVRKWAAEHPLTEPYELRPSIASELMSRMKESERSAVATVGTIADELSALADRLTVYAEHVPHQARWQAELLLDERGLDGGHIEQMQEDITALRTAVESMTSDARGIPVAIRVDVPDLERQLRPRIDSLQAFGHAALADLKYERDGLMEFVRQERAALVQDLASMSEHLTATATDRLVQTLTGKIWAGILILLLLLAIPFWLGLLTGRVMLRRSSP